jgi:hypothetical protein
MFGVPAVVAVVAQQLQLEQLVAVVGSLAQRFQSHQAKR